MSIIHAHGKLNLSGIVYTFGNETGDYFGFYYRDKPDFLFPLYGTRFIDIRPGIIYLSSSKRSLYFHDGKRYFPLFEGDKSKGREFSHMLPTEFIKNSIELYLKKAFEHPELPKLSGNVEVDFFDIFLDSVDAFGYKRFAHHITSYWARISYSRDLKDCNISVNERENQL